MGAVIRADADRVDLAAGQQFSQVRRHPLGPVLLGQRARLVVVDVADRRQRGAVQRSHRLGVALSDSASANDSESETVAHQVSLKVSCPTRPACRR